jgi:CelD/BcsL family acetyltransferase involved in cellulose biosynthesis
LNLCVELAKGEHVWLSRLTVDGRPIAWELLFKVGETLSDFLTTYDLDFAAYSPGQLIFVETVRYAIARGARRLEMGRGDQDYKFWFGAKPCATQNILVHSRHPRSGGYVGYEMARKSYQRLLTRPVVERFIERFRANVLSKGKKKHG